jgi:hypothetical protein
MAALGTSLLRTIYLEILDAGFRDPGTKYLVYYDGTHSTCGSATQDGPVAALYLKGRAGTKSCITPFSQSSRPGYWEYTALHEIIHTLGIVDPDAPRHDAENPWHVRDAEDLMHGGGGVWLPAFVDRHQDSYHGADVPPAIRNLSKDPILIPVPLEARPGSGAFVSPPTPLSPFPHEVLRWRLH